MKVLKKMRIFGYSFFLVRDLEKSIVYRDPFQMVILILTSTILRVLSSSIMVQHTDSNLNLYVRINEPKIYVKNGLHTIGAFLFVESKQ